MPGHPGNPRCGPGGLPVGLDPETATRREFTDQMTALATPNDYPGVKPKWLNVFTTHQELLRKLAYHEAMEPNIDDPYLEPAVRKSKVYQMWDFVGRTLSMLLAVDFDLPRSQREHWQDVSGRAMYVKVLMTTENKTLDLMCPDDYGQGVEFGPEILEVLARIRQ